MAKQEPTNCFHTGRMSRFCQAYRPRCSNSFASYSAPFKSTHYRIARSVSVCRYRGRCLTPCGFNTWSPSEIDAWRPREVRGDPSLRLDPRRGYPEGKLAPQDESGCGKREAVVLRSDEEERLWSADQTPDGRLEPGMRQGDGRRVRFLRDGRNGHKCKKCVILAADCEFGPNVGLRRNH